MSTISKNSIALFENLAVQEAAFNGLIPHKGVIEDYLKANMFGSGSEPQSSFLDLVFEEGEPLSASRFSELMERINLDETILLSTLNEQATACAKICTYLVNQDESIRVRARVLNNQLGALLAVNNSGESNSSIIEDFSSSKNVNLNQTTAFCDFKNRLIASNFEKAPWPLSGNITFDVLDKNNILSISTPSPLENLLLDGSDSWRAEITTSNSSLPVVTQLRLKLSEEPVAVSALGITLKDSTVPTIISILGSTDGINFETIIDSFTLNTGLVFFDTQYITDLAIRITRSNADNILADGRGQYVIDIKKISALWINEEKREKFSYLETNDLMPITNISFSSVALDVCETLPENTNIIYKVSFKTGEDYTPWVELKPKSRNLSSFEEIVASLPGIRNESSFSGLSAKKLEHVICQLDTSNYSLNQGNISFNLPSSTIRSPKLLLWRNISQSLETTYKKGQTTPGGWMIKDGFYQSWLNFQRPSSLSISSNQGLIIDGQFKSGSIGLDKGPHLFQVKMDNWDTGANYKNLVNSLVTSGVANIQAAIVARLVSQNEFLYIIEGDDYSKFCISSLGEGDGIFIKGSTDLSNTELYTLTGSAGISTTLADSVKLRIEFVSDGEAIPSLSAFNLNVSR